MSGPGIGRPPPPVRAGADPGDAPHRPGSREERRAPALPPGMPPPLSARTSTAAGPVRRALPAPAGEVTASTQATGAGSNLKPVFEQALSHVTEWRASAKRSPSLHGGMEAPALQAMETAQGGLDAWNALPGHVRKATMESRNALLDRRADAAVIGLLAMTRLDVSGLMDRQIAALQGVAASNTSVAACHEQLGQDLLPIEKKHRQLHAAHEVLLEARLNKRLHNEEDINKAIASVPLHQYDCSSVLVQTHFARLLLDELPDDVQTPALALRQLTTGPAAFVLTEAVHTLTGGSTDPAKLAVAADRIERSGELLAALAERFCLAAAQEAGRDGSSDLWQHALACADAIYGHFSPLLDLAAAVPRAGARASSSSVPAPSIQVSQPDEWAVVLPSPSQRPDKAASRKKSRGRTRIQAAGTARRADGPSGTPQQQAAAAAAPDALVRVLKRAEIALAMHPLTLVQAEQSGGDPVRIAAALGKDTKVVDLMKREGHDPLSIAHSTRFSMQAWFGDLGPLRRARDELRSRPAPDDARMPHLSGQLDERIEALERIHRRVNADEADALKCHPFPKARHVERMWQLGAIEQVSAPKPLRSGNTPPGLSDVFEMVIVPAPVSDGSPSAPLYLHLHTDHAISAEACRKLPFERFAAVHVKTAAQKDMGAQWEEAQRSLGRLDAKVHRGKVDARLLDSLRSLARAPGRTA
jgi:hypothetical protein